MRSIKYQMKIIFVTRMVSHASRGHFKDRITIAQLVAIGHALQNSRVSTIHPKNATLANTNGFNL